MPSQNLEMIDPNDDETIPASEIANIEIAAVIEDETETATMR